jgi:hypothetical protein
VKRLYEMTGRELREEAEAAEARGDQRRATECWEQLSLLGRISEAFKAKCRAALGEPDGR